MYFFWVHWFVYLCSFESCWASLKIIIYWVLFWITHRSLYLWGQLLEYFCVPLVVSCFFAFSCFCWVCIDICAFACAVTFASLFGLTLVGKDSHLEVTVRVMARWDATSLVLGKEQWCSLCATLSARIDVGQTVGLLWQRLQRICRWQWHVGIFRSLEAEAAEVLLFFFLLFFIFACGTSRWDPSWSLIWSADTQSPQSSIRPRVLHQVHVELPQLLGLGAQVHLQQLWHWCLGYGCV